MEIRAQKIVYEYENIALDISIPDEMRGYFTHDWNGVRSTQFCGALKIGTHSLTILPKIDKQSFETNLNYLTYMLSYVYDLPIQEERTNTHTEESPILELFIGIFARELITEVEKGLYREYVSVQENLRVMRGRLMVGMDARTNFVRDKVYCEYDEFSPNNALNALFAYAINLCRRATQSDHNRQKLGILHLMFDEIPLFYSSHTSIHWHRLNERFRSVYRIALLII